ncbi:DNA-protecting protein DprA [Methylomonas sp. EFPC1]|uniref:DNA-processing protein DprA n=1 Tax=unclassified Methylomonas TaxID=2608980 RepID=UPI000C34FB36|nr:MULTISPECIES: DNA-processing protein DprA [unclassified Methylomonas]PKD38113.1 DNA-processing protein DprA [Methylomonas sp. Kb3]QSB03047.1 DNA-protecting protein DprA [Methylomonas sp. EFPC1]
MNLSPTAQATLLLTSYFTKASSDDVKPLTNVEWGRFALWLKGNSTTPADLLVAEPKSLLNGWHDSRISIERVLQLLNRGHSLALAVEKWQRAGLWVVTRSDPEYPRRLKQRLKTDSPPVLFGCGDKALLNSGGLAVIGSRNASESDLSFTEQVGAKAAGERIAIVSGGARGVDEAAMLGAAKSSGLVIGVMADSLLRAATSAKWRKGLMDGNTVLVSPFYPEAGFSAGNAMARNKYIYCLADSSLVIHSGKKGGTLNGAEENLKKGWVPLWVKPSDDKNAANADLVAKGGRWCEADIQHFDISVLLVSDNKPAHQLKEAQEDLFSIIQSSKPVAQHELYSSVDKGVEQEMPVVSNATAESMPDEYQESVPHEEDESMGMPVDFYQFFLDRLRRLAGNPVTLDELMLITGLHKSQLNDWLNRATDDGVVKKFNRPVRYQCVEKT